MGGPCELRVPPRALHRRYLRRSRAHPLEDRLGPPHEAAIGEPKNDGKPNAREQRQPIPPQIRGAEAENIDEVVQKELCFAGRWIVSIFGRISKIFLLEINLSVGMKRDSTFHAQ